MTKKELKWRLSDLPTASEVADLVEQEIITKDEAREILFNEQEPEKSSKEVKALKEQIKFLNQVIEAISQRRSEVITVYSTFYPYWYWPSRQPNWVKYGGIVGNNAINAVHTTAGSLGGYSSSITSPVSVNTAKLIS